MRLTLAFDGQRLGDVEFGPPGERGLRQGILAPNAAYTAVRARLQEPLLGLAQLQGASAEEIRSYLIHTQQQLAASGLVLLDATGAPTPTTFLLIGDAYPLDIDFEVLEALKIPVSATFAPAT
jgi:hypothetical protein